MFIIAKKYSFQSTSNSDNLDSKLLLKNETSWFWILFLKGHLLNRRMEEQNRGERRKVRSVLEMLINVPVFKKPYFQIFVLDSYYLQKPRR